MTHTIVLPNSAFLGNFEKFTSLNTFLENSPLAFSHTNPRFTSLHPLILAMLKTLSPLPSYLPQNQVSIKTSFDLENYFSTLSEFHLNPEDNNLIKYILSELTRNTLEHSQDQHGATMSLTYAKKSHTLRLGVVDRGVGIPTTIRRLYPNQTDYETIITSLTPGVTSTTQFPGGSTQNAGAGLFFVKSLAHQLGSHFLLYSGTGLFKLLKRKTIRNILHADSTRDHASGGNDYPYWQGTAVGVDIPLDRLSSFSTALSQIRASFIKSLNTPSSGASFI